MVRGLRFLFIISLAAVTIANAQVGQGGLKGKVLDKGNNEPIPFANVVVEMNGNQVAGTTTDFDGNFFIKPLAPGKYDVKATYVGFQAAGYSGIIISADKISFQDIKMSAGTGVQLKEFEFIEYDVPLIDKDNTATGGTITREDIARMPGRSAESAALTVGGIYSRDGERGNVRGSRTDATDTYVDGVKIRGVSSLPNSAIEQVTVITGGVSAQYGDATGGIISITTRGPSSTYFGGIEFVSSRLTDKFGYNLMGFTVSGPLLKIIDRQGSTRKKPLLGFFLSGELNYLKDGRPSAIGSWKVKDDVLTSLHENPLRPSGTGAGVFPNAEFIHISDLERIQATQNTPTQGMLLQGKVEIATTATTNLTLGGSFDYNNARIYSYNNLLFNSENNGLATSNDWIAYTRFTQRFGGDAASQQESASNIKNAYYTLQVDYSKQTQRQEDKRHRDNLFNYGHIGKFTSTFINNYQYSTTDSINGEPTNGFFHNNFRQVSYDFEADTINNPILANYTQNYYDLYDNPIGNYQNPVQVQAGGGLLNGGSPANVYSLWNAAGIPFNRYSHIDNSQFRMRATGSADIKNHAILIGFEYEQRSDRAFTVGPYGLWTRGRALANSHIGQLDRSDPEVEYKGTYPTITYKRLNASPGDYNANNTENQYFFDYNLRKSLGLDPDGIDFLDMDSYDPSQFKLDYFSANELLVNGFSSSLVSYYGYDHTGKKLKNQPSFDDFFTARDEYGNLKREIGAFQPIYISGYIQDKFAFDDLVFNIGLRVDRFDANQKVLKDPYSLFETVKAGEKDFDHPENIGDDYVMYVSDINDPTVNNIVGYRNGDQWFNAEGVEINDPAVLLTPTGISPWLLDPSKNTTSTDLSSSAFKDYDPQVTLMPRIAFSFPISDEALFFAHYDVLSRRPNTINNNLRLDPTEYLFIENASWVLNNPDMKPEKTIDYQLGFQQKLTKSSSLKLAAFYKEMRNLPQVVSINYAYPRTYRTYGNIDFGTVKGMMVTYDLRRTGNVSLRTTYTLQFADGTGSTETTGINLINAGQPNLRQALPLSYDQRHLITIALDYRYGTGKDYNGPIWFDKQILANTGVNITSQVSSGVPYTRQSNITPTAFIGGVGTGLAKGSQNGSRLPWSSTMSIRIDRDINLEWGKQEEKKKTAGLNVYVLLLNPLNSKNIISVYNYTGNNNDDGYLAAAQYQAEIQAKNDPQAYSDLYNVKLNNPGNYSLPRRIRLGLQLNF